MKNKVFLLGLMSLLLVSSVIACSCIALPITEDRYNNAAVVFRGTAEEVIKMESYPVQQRVTFEVEKYWKNSGSNVEEVIITVHETDGANCGYNFQEGEEYIFYGYIDSETGVLTTNSCMQTMLVSESGNEEAELNDLATAVDPEDDDNDADDSDEDSEDSGNVFSRFFSWLKNLFS